MACKDAKFMTSLPADTLTEEKGTMKVWLENYRPVRQRAVRSETTKDKAGALSPAVYAKENPTPVTRVHFPAGQVNTTHTASLENRSAAVEGWEISFVSDTIVPKFTLASEADFKQVEECESDSDHSDSADFDSEELVTGKLVITRSGRQVKAWIGFEV